MVSIRSPKQLMSSTSCI